MKELSTKMMAEN